MIPGNTSSQGKYVDPPTSVSATAGNGQATVSFTLPVYDGKGVATFVATSSPGGFTASGASSPITVTGLSNGTAYTFTVTTISGYGVSTVSGASNSVSPVAPTTTTTAAPATTTAAPATTTTTAAPNPCAGCLAAGTSLGVICVPGTVNSADYYADGCCGSYYTTVYPDQAACGWVAPTTTTTTAAPTTTTTKATTTKATTTTTKATTTTTKAPTVFRLCTAGNVGFGGCTAINQCRSSGASGSICS